MPSNKIFGRLLIQWDRNWVRMSIRVRYRESRCSNSGLTYKRCIVSACGPKKNTGLLGVDKRLDICLGMVGKFSLMSVAEAMQFFQFYLGRPFDI